MLVVLKGHGFNPVSPIFNDWVLSLLVIRLSMVKPELGNLSSFAIRYLVFLLRMLLGSILFTTLAKSMGSPVRELGVVIS